MKKICTLALGMLSALPLLAANTVNYQAVINNAAGEPAADSNIGLQFTILDGENAVYIEEAVVKSNNKGLVEYEIGSAHEDAFATIDWSANLTLQVGIDLAGGENYSSVYSSTIQAVPNALYSVNGAQALDQADFNAGEISRLNLLISQLQNQVAEIEPDATDAIEQAMVNGEKIYKLEGDVRSLQSDVIEIKDAADENYDDLKGQIDRNTNLISQLQSAVATLDPENTADALDQALANAGAIERCNLLINQLQNQMSEANENYDVMAGDIDRVRALISQLQNEMSAVNENYDLTVGDFERVNSLISQLQNEMATATDMIDVNTGAIERNSGLINQLQSQMSTSMDDYDALAGSVERNANNITSLQNEVAASQEDYDTLAGSVQRNANNITSLQNEVATTNDMVDQNTGSIERNAGNITQLQSQVATLTENMNDLPNAYAEKLNDLRTEVGDDYDSLSGSVMRNTSLITNLQNEIEALKAEIEALKKAAE